MQRASRQRIALALIFCLVQSGMLSSAPRWTTQTPGQHVVLPARGWYGSPVPHVPFARPPVGVPGANAASPIGAPGDGGAPPLPCDTPANEIVAENCQPGSTDWAITGSGSVNIQGFATDISVNLGQQVAFKIDTPATCLLYTSDAADD